MISCLFEIALHPNWLALLSIIPPLGRRKAFFTTNLSRPLGRQDFAVLRRSNIHHINISVESLNPGIYESLRHGSHYNIFLSNLNGLVRAFSEIPDAPLINFTTMVLKQNLSEIRSLVERCHKELMSVNHELRTPYIYSCQHMQPNWVNESLITNQEWEWLIKEISPLGYPVGFGNPPGGEGGLRFDNPPEDSLDIRIESNGIATFLRNGEKLDINIVEMPDLYFRNKLHSFTGYKT